MARHCPAEEGIACPLMPVLNVLQCFSVNIHFSLKWFPSASNKSTFSFNFFCYGCSRLCKLGKTTLLHGMKLGLQNQLKWHKLWNYQRSRSPFVALCTHLGAGILPPQPAWVKVITSCLECNLCSLTTHFRVAGAELLAQLRGVSKEITGKRMVDEALGWEECSWVRRDLEWWGENGESSWHGAAGRERIGGATWGKVLQRWVGSQMDLLDVEYHGKGWKFELLKMGVSVVRMSHAGGVGKHNGFEEMYTELGLF